MLRIKRNNNLFEFKLDDHKLEMLQMHESSLRTDGFDESKTTPITNNDPHLRLSSPSLSLSYAVSFFFAYKHLHTP